MCYQTSDMGLIYRGSSCQQIYLSPRAARPTQPSILPRSLNAYRIIPRLTPGQRRWGFINHHWWYDWRLSTCNLMSAGHTQVDWSTEPRGSRRVVTLVRGYLYEKKRPGFSLVNQVNWLAGMILIFFYMRSFLPVCRDEYVTWHCFEFGSVWF